MKNMDLTQMVLTGASFIIIGMCGWLLTTVNSMEKEVQLISYKVSEAETKLHSIQLTDPSHSPTHCPICLHMKLGY